MCSSNCTGFRLLTATTPVPSGSFECDRFEDAFGAVLTTEQIDMRLASTQPGILYGMASFFNGKQFNLPGGAVGRAFAELLTKSLPKAHGHCPVASSGIKPILVPAFTSDHDLLLQGFEQ